MLRSPRLPARRVLGIACALALAVAGDAAAAFPLTEPPEQVDGPIGTTIAVLDYDGDGLLDLAGLGDDGTLTLRLGTATAFAAAQSLAVPGAGYTRALVSADVTGDGRDDLVAAFGATATLVLIRGRADGVLAAPAAGDVHAMGSPSPCACDLVSTSLDVADVDGDDDLDVAAGMGVKEDGYTPPNSDENGHVTIFVNHGGGGLAASPDTLPVNAPVDLLLVRLAGDADPDLLVAQRHRPRATAVKVFPGSTGAAFGAGAYADAGEQASELDVGDFNDDGRADLVVAHAPLYNPAAPATVLPGTAAPASLGAPITVPAADGDHVIAADLDRDGRDDLYVADGRTQFPGSDLPDDPIFVRGLGNMQFGARQQAADEFPRYEAAPQLADIDGDGKDDVVTSGMNGNIGPVHVFIRYGLGPELVPTPRDLDFGFVALRSPVANQSVSYMNIGPGTATGILRDRAGDVGDFPVVHDGCSGATLAVDATCTVQFGFAPTALGDRIAGYLAYAPDADFLDDVGMIGTALAPAPPAMPPAVAPPPPPPPAAAPVPRAAKPVITATTRRALLRRGLRFTQRFPAAGSVRWTLELASGRTVLARATRTLTTAGIARVTIVLRGSGRRRFARGRATRLVLRTVYAPAGRPRGSLATAVRLRR